MLMLLDDTEQYPIQMTLQKGCLYLLQILIGWHHHKMINNLVSFFHLQAHFSLVDTNPGTWYLFTIWGSHSCFFYTPQKDQQLGIFLPSTSSVLLIGWHQPRNLVSFYHLGFSLLVHTNGDGTLNLVSFCNLSFSLVDGHQTDTKRTVKLRISDANLYYLMQKKRHKKLVSFWLEFSSLVD